MIPNCVSDGPAARMSSLRVPVPAVITKPGVRVPAAPPTWARVERLTKEPVAPTS